MAGAVHSINRLELPQCSVNNTGNRSTFIGVRKIRKQILNQSDLLFDKSGNKSFVHDSRFPNGLHKLQRQCLMNKLEEIKTFTVTSNFTENELSKDSWNKTEPTMDLITIVDSESKEDRAKGKKETIHRKRSEIPAVVICEGPSVRTSSVGTAGSPHSSSGNVDTPSVAKNGHEITDEVDKVSRKEIYNGNVVDITEESIHGNGDEIEKLSRTRKSLEEQFCLKSNNTCTLNTKLVPDTESPIQKSSLLITDNMVRSGRRDSVVAMSTRRMSLAPSMGKTKVRKTSFVPLRTGERRNSLFVQGGVPGNFLQRKQSKQNQQMGRKTIDVVIFVTEEKEKVIVDVDSVLHSIHNIYPSSNIEIINPDGHCLRSSERILLHEEKIKEHDSNMPPRNISPPTVYNEKHSIKEVIDCVKKQKENVSCQIEFCRKMAAFATDDSLNVLLAKQEGISIIIKAIRDFKQNKDLVRTASQTLLKMVTFTDTNCVHIHNRDGISLLADLLQIYIDDAVLLQILLDILGYFAMSDNEDIMNCMLKKSCHTHTLTTMSRHRDNPEIVKRCCFILSDLVNSVETARSLMFIGGVHVIIGVIQKHSFDNEVLENGCRALGSFAIHDDICVDVVNAGAMDITLLALEKSITDENLLECVTWALACLTKYDESCNVMSGSDGLENLVNVMKSYPSKATVQEYGCWTICNFVSHDKVLSGKTSEDIVEVLLDATGMFLDNLDLQEQLFFTISECLTNQEYTIDRFASRNGLFMITRSMSQYPEHCILQEHGCRIIGNVAVNEEYRRSTEEFGASKVVASAMLTLEHCEELQEIGCLALTNITANMLKNKSSAVSNGCVSAVLRAMVNYGSSLNIVLSGVKTICNVIEIDEACYHFLEEGGLNIFGEFVSSQGQKEEIIEVLLFASNVVSRLSSILGIADHYLKQVDILLTNIDKLLEGNTESVFCQCTFYENLLQTEKGYRLFKDINALPKVLKWIGSIKEDISIQTSGCKILAAISLYDKDKSLEVFDVMKECMCNFQGNSDIQLICCGAVVYIADHNERCRNYLRQLNTMALIVKTIKQHMHELKLVDVAIMALDALCNKYESNAYSKKQIETGVLLEAVRMYPDNSEIQIHGCKVISEVNAGQQNGDDEFPDIKRTCDHLVNVLKKRRSNSELQTAALNALKTLLAGESEDIINTTKKELSFLSGCWN